MIKIVFFDIDGTLVNDSAKVLPSTRMAIDLLKNKGVICAIATGRGPYRLDRQVDGMEMDVYVTYNGQFTYTENQKEILREEPLAPETVETIIRIAKDQQYSLLLGEANQLRGSRFMLFAQKPYAKRLKRYLPKSDAMLQNMQQLKSWIKSRCRGKNRVKWTKRPVYQIIMMLSKAEQVAMEKDLPPCKITRSNPYSADIISEEGSKMKGIEAVLDYYGLQVEEAAAFGDSWNDSEMLNGVGIGVAMGNAAEEIKKQADIITTSHNEDGIARGLYLAGILNEDEWKVVQQYRK